MKEQLEQLYNQLKDLPKQEIEEQIYAEFLKAKKYYENRKETYSELDLLTFQGLGKSEWYYHKELFLGFDEKLNITNGLFISQCDIELFILDKRRKELKLQYPIEINDKDTWQYKLDMYFLDLQDFIILEKDRELRKHKKEDLEIQRIINVQDSLLDLDY